MIMAQIGRRPRKEHMRNIYKGFGVGIAALVLAAALPASAEADTLTPSCSTTGANGTINVAGFTHKDTHINVWMTVLDTLADGHSVRIRLITKNAAGTYKYWPWHAEYGGKGAYENWTTYADDSGGIINVAAQVARFEGDTMLNSCTDWALGQTPD